MSTKMNDGRLAPLYQMLVSEIDETAAARVSVGLNWTLVQGAAGCGLAQTPRRDTPGCAPIRKAGELSGSPLRELAGLSVSENPMEAAIGMAAINAFFNRYDLEGAEDNGLDAFRECHGPTTVIGRFPDLSRRLKNCRVIEKEPREGEYPESEAENLLPESEAVVITASALVNHSLPRLLELAKGARIALVGPGTPLSPIMYACGIEILAGMVIRDPDGAAQVVSEGGAVSGLRRHARFLTMRLEH